MTKIDIISGFLGAGKTTLIKKLLSDCFKGEKIVLVENEFGEIGVDGTFMKEVGIEVNEINSGCICCSLKGDFSKALVEVIRTYHPDRILIEPSGVGKLSDVIEAAKEGLALLAEEDALDGVLNSFTAVSDVTKCKMFMKNFGEFYNDQIAAAHTVILSRTQKVKQEKLEEAVALIKSVNPDAVIITTPWDDLEGEVILSAMEKQSDMMEALMEEVRHLHHHHHHDHDHECDDPNCECHHHHDHDEEHHHHHHDHECDDPNCECHHHHDHDEEHHHHHDHECDDPNCECHHHHDHDEEHHHHDHECDDPNCECHHHHDHHADEVFMSWGVETAKSYSADELDRIMDALQSGMFGTVLRAKGVVSGGDVWYHFDMTPGETVIRLGCADYTGRICVIGLGLKEKTLENLFGVKG